MEFTVETKVQEELLDVTNLVRKAVSASKAEDGLCLVFCPHTTAAVTVNENADPDVRSDILKSLRDMVKDVGFAHSEGNSPAHVKSSLLGCGQTFIVKDGKLVLGTWQGIYLAEFDGPGRRKVLVKVMGG